MNFMLGDMLDKIVGYVDILKDFGFKDNGTGTKPWSISHINDDGVIIDTRNSEWTMYKNGKEIVGKTPEELHRLLLSDLSKEDLIEIALGK